MKKISVFTIIMWIVLFVIGLAAAIVCSFFPILTLWGWLFAAAVWLADAIWITVVLIRFFRSKAQKRGAALVGNQAVHQRIMRETEEAVARYLSSVNRQGLMKRAAINDRPWFLLCGDPKSGKTSLLKGSGLSFPVSYPSDRDGAVVEGANQVQWYFGNEAVWIDTPGRFMQENGKEEWQALVDALQKVRPDCPASGVAMVVNVSEVLNADDLRIKEIAQRLRGRIDDLIARWGIEFPVYLLFNHADEIPGFNEYFSEQIASGDDQIFGATIPIKSSQGSTPKMVFAEEFGLLGRSLSEFRLDRLHKEPSAPKKRMICRFSIHFQGIQQKLGVLAAELFKPSSYVGKPIFRGFYFTSCRDREVSTGVTAEVTAKSPEIGATIVNHPFNPHRALGGAPKTGTSASVLKREIKSFFVLPLFREIMTHDRPLVKATHIRTRKTTIRRIAIYGSIGLAALLVSLYLISGSLRVSGFYGEVETVLAKLPPESGSLADQYTALDEMQVIMGRLQKYDGHVPFNMGIGLYHGNRLLQGLKRSYCVRLKRCMLDLAKPYFEGEIHRLTDASGEFTGDGYEKLYHSLKAYLSISEAAARHPNDIDTAFLRPVLFNAIGQSILGRMNNADRLPEKIETVIQENMGLLLTYLRRGDFVAIQEDQNLVARARERLRRLPNGTALYEGAMGQLLPTVNAISLADLLGAQSSGSVLQNTKTVSVLYTQEGWEKSVQPALKAAAENPYKVDWVIGLTKDDVHDESLDKGQLYDAMLDAYLTDFKKQWCDFLGAVTLAPFDGLPQSGRMLRMLVGDQSELLKLMTAVGKYTQLSEESLLDKSNSAIAAASRIKPAKQLAATAGRVARNLPFGRDGATPFDDLNSTFKPLRSFVESSAGGAGGFSGYKEKVLLLADKLLSVESGGENQLIAIFSGRDDDPLYTAWNYTKSTVDQMPPQLASGVGPLLQKPIELTGAAASDALTRALNVGWQNDVVKPFTNRFSGRYPFSPRGDDAAWGDVMDFFRPSTGTFWGFYDRVLSPYIIKKDNQWNVRKVGCLQLNFNPDLLPTFLSADIIRTVFFKPDGSPRSLDLTVQPSGANKVPAKLEIDGQTADLPPGAKSARFIWPSMQGQTQGASLKLLASSNFWQDISYSGSWGLMKLLNAAKVNRSSGTSFTAKWQINNQGISTLFFDAYFQVSASDHPFSEPVFQQFKCPSMLVLAKGAQ
jgi:type VI secretion system protein ImpL